MQQIIMPIGVDRRDTIVQPPMPNRMAKYGRSVLSFLARVHLKKDFGALVAGWRQTSESQPDLRKDWRDIISGWDDGGHWGAPKMLASAAGLFALQFKRLPMAPHAMVVAIIGLLVRSACASSWAPTTSPPPAPKVSSVLWMNVFFNRTTCHA